MNAVSTRVLVVEDEPCDAVLLNRSLRASPAGEERFEVRHAATLAEGLESLKRDPVDVLILDLGLPDSDGLDTVVRLRDGHPQVPLVVFTGADDLELAARSFEAGADEYLVKSDLQARVLRRTIRHAIERRRLRLQAPPPASLDGLLHDLRNLQTLILGNAQLLRDDASDSPLLRERAEALLRAARIAAELTDRMSSRPDGPRAPAQPVELSDFVRSVEPLMRTVVPERVTLVLDLPAGLARATVRVEQLFCALLELIVNAVDAIGDSDGSVELRTGATVRVEGETPGLIAPEGIAAGPHVWFEVRDTGRGFDSAALFRLLKPGFSTKGPGHGYGLTHLEEILAEHRAALFVESRPGCGARFRILLPARD